MANDILEVKEQIFQRAENNTRFIGRKYQDNPMTMIKQVWDP